MQYKNIIQDDNVIEFHNSWAGVETVYLNGQVVSKKSSFWGTSHYFESKSGEEQVRYILTSKVDSGMQVKLDLIKNGALVQGDIPVEYGSMPNKPEEEYKEKGKNSLKLYDLDEALQEFQQAEKINPRDPEVYFLMACVYSIKEDVANGFSCLKNSVENSLVNTEEILTHDMLAYLRIQPEFEAFRESGFQKIPPVHNKDQSKI